MSKNNDQIKKLITSLISSLNPEEIIQILDNFDTEKRLAVFKKVLEENLIARGEKDETV